MCSAMADLPMPTAELARICAATPPRPHHGALLAAVAAMRPDLNFHLALTRGGWYRPGGVIAASGERLSSDLQRWAEQAWQACSADAASLARRLADADLLATRISGRSHYFVAAYGNRGAEYLQLEVEELQEVADRHLLDPDAPPEDLAQLLEPEHPLRVDPQPVAPPRYALRRLTDIHAFLVRLQGQSPLAPPVVRFLAEWDASSAGRAARFCDEWVLALAEHLDRYKQARLSAKPIPAPRKRSPPQDLEDKSGGDLGAALQIYDRYAGYPFAWYFHMVTNKGVSRSLAAHVGHDLRHGYDYLPARDAKILADWLDRPYCV